MLLNDQSALFWKLPASRISTSSEDITESPEAIGESRAITVTNARAEAVLLSLIAANEGFLRFKALVLGS